MGARRASVISIVGALTAALMACGASDAGREVQSTVESTPGAVPTPEHVVVVVLENRDPDEMVGAQETPYFSSLTERGALLTDSFGVARPSQPNYLALFSGDTQGVTSNKCPQTFSGPNLARSLRDAGHTFVGFAEDLPRSGFTGCSAGGYERKHAPWVNWTDLPTSVSQPLTGFGPDFATLPTVSFVIPNNCNSTHDCGVGRGDAWLRDRIEPYVAFAMENNSLLIVTFDEAKKNSPSNRIATIFVGPMVVPGQYGTEVDHYRVLRTIADMYDLPPLGRSAKVAPITEIWAATN